MLAVTWLITPLYSVVFCFLMLQVAMHHNDILIPHMTGLKILTLKLSKRNMTSDSVWVCLYRMLFISRNSLSVDISKQLKKNL